MKRYLLAKKEGESVYGIDIKTWDDSVTPFIISENSEELGYVDISSIENWYNYQSNFDIIIVKGNIKILLEETEWIELSLREKEIVSKLFLVEKEKRDEILSEELQNSLNYFKIYDLISDDTISNKGITNFFLTPKSIDYKIELNTRLHPDYTFDEHGWLVECIYYRNCSIWQNELGFTQYDYSDPILKYEADYTMKDDGYVGSRTVTRRWYRLDGSLDDDAKVTTKFYEPMLARDEGKKRRRNVVNQLMIETVGLFIMTSEDLNDVPTAEADAIPFLKSISSGLTDYYEYGNKRDSTGKDFILKEQILASDYSRLDNFVPGTGDTLTIRNYLIMKLDV